LSQHLAKMREEKIVAFRRDGQSVFYRVADPRIALVLTNLKSIFC
jgi:ArsR family transcriptional regulator